MREPHNDCGPVYIDDDDRVVVHTVPLNAFYYSHFADSIIISSNRQNGPAKSDFLGELRIILFSWLYSP